MSATVWYNPFSWFGGSKITPFNLQMTKGFSSNKEHIERKVSVSSTNLEANTLRYSNDMVSAYSKTVKRGVVGTGFSLQFKTDDDKINTEVEKWLKFCSKKGRADFTKRFFRQKFERMIVDELAIKGGVMVRHHWDKRHPALYSPELLSMDTIDRAKHNFEDGTFSGIKTNKFGQIVGIWLYNNQKRDISTLVSIKNLEIEILEFDPHQYGNISPLATIMLRLDDMSTYTAEELKNAKKRAEKSLVAATPAVDKYLLSLEEYIQEQTKLQNTANVRNATEEYKRMLKEFSAPGFHDAAQMMMADTKIYDLQQGGSSQYNELLIQSKQTVSRGLGYSTPSIMGIPENSYNSALKSSQDEEEENAILGQSVMAICEKIELNRIEAGVLLDKINIKDFYTNRDEYEMSLHITRRTKGHIDPSKQANAYKTAVDNGFNSKISVITGQNNDYEDVIKDEVTYELKRKELLEKAGLEYVQTGTEKLTIEKQKIDNINKGKTDE